MCKYKSMILKKDGSVLYDMETDNHSRIILNTGLSEAGDTTDWMRVEILPKNGDRSSRNRDDWTFRVDEVSEPEWFERQRSTFIDKCFDALWEFLDKRICRFAPAVESALVAELSEWFDASTYDNTYGMREDDAAREGNICVAFEHDVCMVVGVSEQAKRLLCRFVSEAGNIKNREILDKIKLEPNGMFACASGFNVKYLLAVPRLFGILSSEYGSRVRMSLGNNGAVMFNNNHFVVYVAPNLGSGGL